MPPLEVILPIPLLVGYVALYRFAAPLFGTDKKRAYVLSAATSACMTLLSLPFTASYVFRGLAVSYTQAQHGWRAEVARFGTVLFGVYLVADVSPRCLECSLSRWSHFFDDVREQSPVLGSMTDGPARHWLRQVPGSGRHVDGVDTPHVSRPLAPQYRDGPHTLTYKGSTRS